MFSCIHSFFGHEDPRLRQTLPQACRGKVFFHPFRPVAVDTSPRPTLKASGSRQGNPVLQPAAGAIDLNAADLAEACRLLELRGVEPGHFILLMPGSGSRTKNWPAESYLELARHLGESTPIVTVLGPAEEDLDQVFSGLGPVKSPPLGTLAGMARLSLAFIGNDSGTSHLAAAAGAHGMVIFGPTDPERWRPLGRVTVLRRMPLPGTAMAGGRTGVKSQPRSCGIRTADSVKLWIARND